MIAADFNKIVKGITNDIKDVLCVKAAEYALNTDRLEAFKRGAQFLNTNPGDALLGMLNKHMVSIYTMVQNNGKFSIERWHEKIVDAINYLILLFAIKAEEMKNATNKGSNS